VTSIAKSAGYELLVSKYCDRTEQRSNDKKQIPIKAPICFIPRLSHVYLLLITIVQHHACAASDRARHDFAFLIVVPD
jgi:hypothetical protein